MPKAEGVHAAGSRAGAEDVGAGSVMLGCSGGVGACSVGKSILGTLKLLLWSQTYHPPSLKLAESHPGAWRQLFLQRSLPLLGESPSWD